MEIIRIPNAYHTQIQYLNKDDSEYVLKTIFALAYWEDIKIENSLRWWLVISIWREAIQMENKARAKKWEKRLNEDIATLTQPLDAQNTRPNQVKSNQIKSSQVKSNQDFLNEQSSKNEINDFQELLKEEVTKVWLAYQKWKYERERIKNILTWKDFWELAERVSMTRQEFAINIMKISLKLDFWNWKIYNATTIYKNYAMIYNEAVKKKVEMEQKKNRKITVI